MQIDIHTHNPKTADGTFAIRSLSITQLPHPTPHSQLPTLHSPHSIALHPWHTPPEPHWLNHLRLWAADPRCLMIGECGIDHLRGDTPQHQTQYFEAQIQLSEELQKPLIIHSVKAHSEILQLRVSSRATQPWIIHGYRGSIQMADTLLRHSIHLSFGNYLAQPKTQALLRHLGPDKILLETDDSPVAIADIYRQAAAILAISLQELESAITRHAAPLLHVSTTKANLRK